LFQRRYATEEIEDADNTSANDVSQEDSSLIEEHGSSETTTDSETTTGFLSVNLTETRVLVTELTKFWNLQSLAPKIKGTKSTARVLTSAQSLSLLLEKEEEEAKAKRKEE